MYRPQGVMPAHAPALTTGRRPSRSSDQSSPTTGEWAFLPGARRRRDDARGAGRRRNHEELGAAVGDLDGGRLRLAGGGQVHRDLELSVFIVGNALVVGRRLPMRRLDIL